MDKQGSGEPSSESSEFNSNYITEKSDVSHSAFSEGTSKWLTALETYLITTEATSLELKPKQVGVKEAAVIFEFLTNSHVTELNVCCGNNLTGGVENLIRLLVSSKIKTLSFCRCMVSNKELLQLMEALRNTQVTELNVQHEGCKLYHYHEDGTIPRFTFDPDEKEEFISHLLASHLTRLDFHLRFVLFEDNCSPLLSVLQSTSITNLNLSYTIFSAGILSSLFSSLPNTTITDLKLSNTEISEDSLKHLSLNLRDSNVVNLNLARNRMTDAGLDILTVGLVHSKVSSLDISQNSITGSSFFGLCLKDSQINNLNLSFNDITSGNLLSFPHFLRYSSIVKLKMSLCRLSDELGRELINCLRFSKVKHLDLSWNNLEWSSLLELGLILKDTDLNDVDISGNGLPSEGITMLAGCLKESALKVIKVNNRMFSGYLDLDPGALSLFLEGTKGTPLEIVDLARNALEAEGLETIAASLVNTTFTHLNLSGNGIKNDTFSLARQMKFTAITRLDLSWNQIGDAGTEILANCLTDTKIVHLDLTHNAITDRGAKVLAATLKRTSLRQLQLSENQIGNEGLEILAKYAEGTFITVLDVRDNRGNRNRLIDRVLLENQTSVHRFVNQFKQIAPESNANSFRLGNNIHDGNVDIFLDECLLFYKTVLEQCSIASVLLGEKSFAFSREQIGILLEEEFPVQLAAFITNQIEASPAQHVTLLKRAEELELTKIVEPLLLNRPAFMIDQDIGIMHPFIYRLLHKYKQPLFNILIEPEGKMKIIKYFLEHSNLEGAAEVVRILNGIQP